MNKEDVLRLRAKYPLLEIHENTGAVLGVDPGYYKDSNPREGEYPHFYNEWAKFIPGQEDISLDGNFNITELEQIVGFMREVKEILSKEEK